MELLKTYKKQYNENRLALGSKWQNKNFVFTQENGSPNFPDTLTDYCKEFSIKYNKLINKTNEENKNKQGFEKLKLLPHINPHAFRHTQASLLFFSGADCTTISKRLGHSKVSTTTDIYSHLMQKADETASDTLANLLLNKANNEKEAAEN